MSRSSNSNCGPPSAASAWMAGARSAVIQSRPAGFSSSSIRALVIRPLRVYGGGPPYYKVGGIVTYDLDDIDAWLATHKHTSTSGDQA